MKVLNTPIDVIAEVKKDGTMRPIRFRITEDDEIRVISIQKVVNVAEERIAGINYIKYTCMVVINEMQVLCQLNYLKETVKWTLFKI